MATVLLVGAAATALLAAGPAAASTAEVYGLGPASSAQAGAVAASVTDFSAVYYDPAGLAFAADLAVAVGFAGAGSRLEVAGKRVALVDQSGPLVGARAPLPFGGVLANRITVGFAAYAPSTTLLRVIARHPEEPFFPLFDNRTQRLVLMPAVALRPHDRFGFGIGFNYFGGLTGAVLGATGATRAIEPRADEAVRARVGVHAGVRWDPWRRLSLAFTYRQQFSVPLRVDSAVTVAGSPLNLSVRANGLFTPHALVWGAAFRPRPGTTLGLDVTWARWSLWDGPYMQVTSRLPLAGDVVGELPDVPFHDIVTVHAGGEHRVPVGRRLELRLRAGYGWDPSPVPRAQPGVTNLMDGDKHLVAFGVGARLTRLLPAALTLDAHFGLHFVTGRTYTKRVFGAGEAAVPFDGLRDEEPDTPGVQVSNPGYPAIRGGGFLWSGSVLVGVEL